MRPSERSGSRAVLTPTRPVEAQHAVRLATGVHHQSREILELATPDQLERFIGPLLRHETYEAWAITEPDAAGSDVAALEATATRDGDDWVLNGDKWYVTGGQHASFFIVLAVADGEQTLFFVEQDAPGLEIVRTPRFMDDPYIDRHLELRLTDCRVRDANRVPSGGKEGAKRGFGR